MSSDIIQIIQVLTPIGVVVLSFLNGYINTKLETIRLQVSTNQECLRHIEKNMDDLSRRLGDWQLLSTHDHGAIGARLARVEERARITIPVEGTKA